MLAGKRILLIVGGGIAAYKALELIRLVTKAGASVRVIATAAAREFVTPLSLSALSGDKVYTDLFDLTDEAEMGHIELSRDADLLVVAPATANLMARMAGGLADDLATTALLATDKPVLIAPAMNVRMWQHAATQRNLAMLEQDGVLVTGPDDGDMACGEYGPGRMAEPDAILRAIERHFSGQEDGPLAGRHVIVTSGPTREPIDAVRYLSNHSSGKQGHAIASALAAAGARVTLVAGPVALPDPPGVDTVRVETARDMLAAVEQALPADAGIFAAAVADWRPDRTEDGKIKKDGSGNAPALSLVENPDILATVAGHAQRPRLVIGFAAETDRVLDHAASKLARKGCDWIVANDVSGDVMGGDRNRVHVVTAAGVEDWPDLDKQAVADRLALRIADTLNGPSLIRTADVVR